jgi:CheY-like chemotaxis protein
VSNGDVFGGVLFVDGRHGEYVDALRAAGYRVEVAPTALQALEQGKAFRPDVLIVPMLMPETTSNDLGTIMGTEPSGTYSLAVVILVPLAGERAEARAASGATFCDLPCSPGDLVELVGKQLAARRRIAAEGSPAAS